MSFSAARGASVTFSRNIRRLVQSKKAEIEQVKREVLGHAPQLNIRTGYQMNKKQLTGVYLNQAYPDFIEKSARKVSAEDIFLLLFFLASFVEQAVQIWLSLSFIHFK